MAITENDVKLYRGSKRDQTATAGGYMGSVVVVSGELNNVFNNISRLARVKGDVVFEKLFVKINSPDTDTYEGSFVAVIDPPFDENVNVVLVKATSDGDTRGDIVSKVESYFSIGQEAGNARLAYEYEAGTEQILYLLRHYEYSPQYNAIGELIYTAKYDIKQSMEISVGDLLYLGEEGANGEYVEVQALERLAEAMPDPTDRHYYNKEYLMVKLASKLEHNHNGMDLTRRTQKNTSWEVHGCVRLAAPLLADEVEAQVVDITGRMVPVIERDVTFAGSRVYSLMDYEQEKTIEIGNTALVIPQVEKVEIADGKIMTTAAITHSFEYGPAELDSVSIKYRYQGKWKIARTNATGTFEGDATGAISSTGLTLSVITTLNPDPGSIAEIKYTTQHHLQQNSCEDLLSGQNASYEEEVHAVINGATNWTKVIAPTLQGKLQAKSIQIFGLEAGVWVLKSEDDGFGVIGGVYAGTVDYGARLIELTDLTSSPPEKLKVRFKSSAMVIKEYTLADFAVENGTYTLQLPFEIVRPDENPNSTNSTVNNMSMTTPGYSYLYQYRDRAFDSVAFPAQAGLGEFYPIAQGLFIPQNTWVVNYQAGLIQFFSNSVIESLTLRVKVYDAGQTEGAMPLPCSLHYGKQGLIPTAVTGTMITTSGTWDFKDNGIGRLVLEPPALALTKGAPLVSQYVTAYKFGLDDMHFVALNAAMYISYTGYSFSPIDLGDASVNGSSTRGLARVDDTYFLLNKSDASHTLYSGTALDQLAPDPTPPYHAGELIYGAIAALGGVVAYITCGEAVVRSDDKGLTWDSVSLVSLLSANVGWECIQIVIGLDDGGQELAILNMDDPMSGDRVLLKTTDFENFEVVMIAKLDLPRGLLIYDPAHHVWLYSRNEKLYKSTDGALSFQQLPMEKLTVLQNGTIDGIACDTYGNIVCHTKLAGDDSAVYKSDDGGESWINIKGDIPDAASLTLTKWIQCTGGVWSIGLYIAGQDEVPYGAVLKQLTSAGGVPVTDIGSVDYAQGDAVVEFGEPLTAAHSALFMAGKEYTRFCVQTNGADPVTPGTFRLTCQTPDGRTMSCVGDDIAGALVGDAIGTYDPENGVAAGEWDTAFVPETLTMDAGYTAMYHPDFKGLNEKALPLNGRVPMIAEDAIALICDKRKYRLGADLGDQTTDLTVVLDDAAGFPPELPNPCIALIGSEKVLIESRDNLTLTLVAGGRGYDSTIITTHALKSELELLTYNSEMNPVVSVQAGQIEFANAIANNYSAGAVIASVLDAGSLQAVMTENHTQISWNGSLYQNAVEYTGDPAAAVYNFTDYPLSLANIGAETERWALVVKNTSPLTVDIQGEHLGIVAANVVCTSNVAPINPNVNAPYFTLIANGFGAGWQVGNVLRFNTTGAMAPFWAMRIVDAQASNATNDGATITICGDVPAV